MKKHNNGGATRVPAGEFKARCLQLLDEVRERRREIVITKRGKPVAKLAPVDVEAGEVAGRLGGTVVYHGDIVAPTGERWNADR